MKIALKRAWLLVLPLVLLSQSCGIYSFSGASIPATMKSVSVTLFENTAPLVVPSLSTDFTEGLKNRVRNQTRLNIVRDNADGSFEGTITGYSIQPVAITANEIAGRSRLTITVNVKYTNAVDNSYSFEQPFTRYVDFSPESGNFQTLERQSIAQVVEMLTEDIFNKAFANW